MIENNTPMAEISKIVLENGEIHFGFKDIIRYETNEITAVMWAGVIVTIFNQAVEHAKESKQNEIEKIILDTFHSGLETRYENSRSFKV